MEEVASSQIDPVRPVTGQFYVVSVDSDGPVHSVEFVNERALLSPPRLILRPVEGGFPPLPEPPRLVVTDPDRMPNDLDASFSGYWLVSEALKVVLEDSDPDGFQFVRCEFMLADGSQGEPHYLCDVVRCLDAIDLSASQVKVLTEGYPNGRYYSLTGGAKLAFNADVIRGAHVFRTPYTGSRVFCDRFLFDALTMRGFGEPQGARGVCLDDAADY